MGLNNQNSPVPADASEAPLPRAVEVLFKPIARMLVRQGIGGNTAVEIIKRAYLSATIDVLEERGQPATPARLRIFTGFPGREIDRLKSQIDREAPVDSSPLDQVTKLLTTWHLDSRYSLQFGGSPRELRISGPRDELTFSTLAAECAPSLDPKELLRELVTLGAVQLSEDSKRARPIARAYLPEPLSGAATERLGRMVRNFTETLDWNFQAPTPESRRVDRHVSADFPISAEAEDEFRLKARKEGQALLESLDGWLQQQQPAMENGRRVGLVVFQYVEGAGQQAGEQPDATTRSEDAVRPTLQTPSDVVGPYFMGPVSNPENVPKKNADDEDDVIDVLNYRGPKK